MARRPSRFLVFLALWALAGCGGADGAGGAAPPAPAGGAPAATPMTLGFWTHGFKDESLIGVDWHLDRLEEGRAVMPTLTFPVRATWIPRDEPDRSAALAQLARIPAGHPIALRPPDNLMDGCPGLPGISKYVLDPLSDVAAWESAADARVDTGGFVELSAYLAALRPARVMILDNNEVPEPMQAKGFLASPRALEAYPSMRTEADANQVLAALYAERYGAYYARLQSHFDHPIVVVPYKGLHHGEWLGYTWRGEGHGEVPEGDLSSWDGTYSTIGPRYFQGSSPSIYDNPWEGTSDDILRSPLVRACALVGAGAKDARAINPRHVRCVSLWDGGQAKRGDYGTLLATSPMTPARYKGWAKAVLFLLGPDVVHAYRNHLDLRADHEHYDLALADAVREINEDPLQLAAARSPDRRLLTGPWRHPFSGTWQEAAHLAWAFLRCDRPDPAGTAAPTPLYPPHLDRPPEGQSPPGVPEGQWQKGSFNPNVSSLDAHRFEAVALGIAIPEGIVLYVWCPNAAQPGLRVEVPGRGHVLLDAPEHGSAWLLAPDGAIAPLPLAG